MDPAGRLTGARTRRRHRLAALADIPDGTVRGFAVNLGTRRHRVIVLRRGERVAGFADACPHMGVPLPWRADEYLTPDGRFLRCANHGALFDLDGLCVSGPCKGERLARATIEIADGAVWLVA
jgi:nitrite reductase/ring-hydroxylating ferredoxin subunit